MDTEKGRVLLCALESGSLTAAAERMGYTPSGVSRVIGALEKETGFPLLRRSRGGVEATAECAALLPTLRELVRWTDHWEQLLGETRGLETGSITIGTAYNAYYPWLARLAADFGRRYPGIRVRIVENTSTHLGEMLEDGTVDFAILSRRAGRFRWRKLRRDALVVWVPADHPAVKRGVFSVAELAAAPYIELYPGQETDNSRLLNKLGIRPDTRYATGDAPAACALVAAGLGVVLVNGLITMGETRGVTVLPLDPPQYVDIGVAVPDQAVISPAAARFAAFAQQTEA